MTSNSASARRRQHIVNAFNITLWILQILAAVIFLYVGVSKFDVRAPLWIALFGKHAAPGWIAVFGRIGIGQWFRYFTGGLEIICAILLLIPRLSAIAAVLLACTMVGAILTRLLLLGYNASLPLMLLLITSAIAWRRRTTLLQWKIKSRTLEKTD